MMISCGSKHVEILVLQYSMNIQGRALCILLVECCELSFFYTFLQVLCFCGRNVADLFNTLNQVPQSHIARCEVDNFAFCTELFVSLFAKGKCSHIYLMPNITVILSPKVLSRG